MRGQILKSYCKINLFFVKLGETFCWMNPFSARSMPSVAKNNTGRETFAAVLMPIGARKYEEQLGGAEQSHGGLLLRN